MTVDEQLRQAASHAIAAVTGKHDPRRARSEILTIWANARPKDAKALTRGDVVIAVLRDAPASTLRSPPFILLQALAVVIDVIAKPWDPDAGKIVMSDPVLVLQGYVSAADVDALRRLYETPDKTTNRTLLIAGGAGGVGLLAGYLVSRLLRREASS